MLILLIEDEEKLAEALVYMIKKNGYSVDYAADGENGLALALKDIYDLIILDWMLPGMEGPAIAEVLRKNNIYAPIMFLTARDSDEDKVQGLDAGADDYLVKPFSTDELLARIRALTRRCDKKIVDTCLKTSNFSFNPLSGEVQKDNETVHLTVKESILLETLLRNKDQVLPKDILFEKVWGYNSEADFANVDLYVHYLRKKLNTADIKTIRGIGYTYRED